MLLPGRCYTEEGNAQIPGYQRQRGDQLWKSFPIHDSLMVWMNGSVASACKVKKLTLETLTTFMVEQKDWTSLSRRHQNTYLSRDRVCSSSDVRRENLSRVPLPKPVYGWSPQASVAQEMNSHRILVADSNVFGLAMSSEAQDLHPERLTIWVCPGL